MAIKVGGTTVIDDSRALNNITSVDATTVAALGTAGVGGGGGSFDAVASGSIAAGKPVILNSSGTISEVTTTAGFGGRKNREVYTRGYEFSGVYDPEYDLLVVPYIRDDNSDRLQGQVLFFDSPNDTLDTKSYFQISDSACNNLHTAYDPVEKTFVFIWTEGSTGYYTTAQMQSNGTLTFSTTHGNHSTFSQQMGNNQMVSYYNTDTSKLVFMYRKYSGSYSGSIYYIVGTCSGNSISFGTQAGASLTNTIGVGSYWPTAVTYDESQNKALYCFRNASQSNKLYAMVGTASSSTSTTMTWTTPVELDGNEGTAIDVLYDPESQKNLVIYTNAYYRVLTLSGNSISIGTRGQWYSAGSQTEGKIVFNKATQELNIAGKIANSPRLTSGSISGTTFSASGNTTFTGSDPQNVKLAYADSTARLWVVWTNADSGDRIDSSLTITATNNAGGGNFVGVSSEAIASGATGEVVTLGGVNEAVSGLTVNTRYYVDVGGNLNASASDTLIGRAVAQNKIIITGGA